MPINQPYIPIRDPSSISEEDIIGNGSHQVLRLQDNTIFLAKPIPFVDFEIPGLNRRQLAEANPYQTDIASAVLPAARETLFHLLNHPNIVNLVDMVENSKGITAHPPAGPMEDYTVWEDMNAGSLDALLPQEISDLPPYTQKEVWRSVYELDYNRFGLPESLVWHILRSVSRALLWLHLGIREREPWQHGYGKEKFCQPELDWQPILIRKVDPESVYFKKRGIGETWGACKLGNFRWAKVCGDAGLIQEGIPTEASEQEEMYWAPVSLSLPDQNLKKSRTDCDT